MMVGVSRCALQALAVVMMLSGCSIPTRSLVEDFLVRPMAECPTATAPGQAKPLGLERDRVKRRVEAVKARLGTREPVLTDFVLRVFQQAALPLDETARESIPDLTANELKKFGERIHRNFFMRKDQAQELLEDRAGELREFNQVLIGYIEAYVQGKYVDRFGSVLPAPAISRTIGNTEIAGLLSVVVDSVGDYIIRSPVWTKKENETEAHYPAFFNATDKKNPPKPTGVTVRVGPKDGSPLRFAIPTEPLGEAGQCGIDEAKTKAIEYLGQLAALKASMVGGIAGGSFGGIGVSLGAFGKLSIGDNQTVQVIIKTVLGKVAERAASEAAYRVLFNIPSKKGDETFEMVRSYLDHALNK